MLKSLDEMEGKVRIDFKNNRDIAYFVVLYTSFQIEVVEKNNNVTLSIFAEDWMSFRNQRTLSLEFKETSKKPLEKQVGDIIYQSFVIANRFFANYIMEGSGMSTLNWTKIIRSVV